MSHKEFEDFPGWIFTIDETSAGAYRVIAKDKAGRSVSASGTEPELIVEKCKKSIREMMSRGVFTNAVHGRSGVITYNDKGHMVSMGWEMSGSDRYDILLAPLDLRRWSVPAEVDISRETQRHILQQLRVWLKSINRKSDIDRIEEMDPKKQNCIYVDCSNARLKGLAYCGFHFDETLLK